jgi:hypothetical protein
MNARSNLVSISYNKALMGSSSLMAMLKATYSAAVEERQIWSCNLEDHKMGQPLHYAIS